MAVRLSMFTGRHAPVPPGSKAKLPHLCQMLRRVGAAPLLLLGFATELGWALFGSLGLGLGARPATADRTAALTWLAGAVLLAVATAIAAWLAAPDAAGRS